MNRLDTLLSQVTIFQKLSNEELSQLAPYFTRKNIGKDDVIFHEGTYGNELFIVADGVIAAFIKLSNNSLREVARFSKGDFFGDMSFLDFATRFGWSHPDLFCYHH